MAYKILSLDGGGSWALLQVMALREIYSGTTKGHEILKDFDLVAANSGGSITLGGLIENKTLDELLQDYFLDSKIREKIFVKNHLWYTQLLLWARKRFGIGAPYNAKAKLKGLQTIFKIHGNDDLSTIPSKIANTTGKCPHFLITAFDFDRKRATFFRSNTNSLAASSSQKNNVTLAEAIHASSNAPVLYFDAPAQFSNRQFWDGAIAGYNNPILAAVVEALANHEIPDNIHALSLGTGNVSLPPSSHSAPPSYLTQQPEKSSPFNDLGVLAKSIMSDPPDAASFIAHVAMGQKLPDSPDKETICGNLVRLNPLIQPVLSQTNNSWELPQGISEAQFKDLVSLLLDAITDKEVALIVALGTVWLAGDASNQPIRMNPNTLHCEIGHARFPEAKDYWKQMQ